jgi:hypothetical protein
MATQTKEELLASNSFEASTLLPCYGDVSQLNDCNRVVQETIKEGFFVVAIMREGRRKKEEERIEI